MREQKFYGPWCSFFQFCMDRAKLSQGAFGDLCGETQQMIYQYVSGRSKPPLDKLTLFATSLRLSKDDAERFIWLAHQAYTPTAVWTRIEKLENLVVTMETEIGHLRAELADLTNKPVGPNNERVQ
jgi:transcriptional regulator with XRE-family HTH domain